MDPGDAFAFAYDALEPRTPGAADLQAWSIDPDFRTARAQTRDELNATGGVDPDRLRASSPSALLGTLSGLDVDLREANPRLVAGASGTLDAVPRRLRDRFSRTGRFNDQASGAVLPRYVERGRPGASPQDLAEVFMTARVPETSWRRCFQVNLHAPLMRYLDIIAPPGGTISLAQLPFAAAGDVVMTHDVTAAGIDVYLASPRDGLEDRVTPAMSALRGAGSHLALIPESTLNDATLSRWQAEANPDNPDWMLVGTGPVSGSHPGASATTHLDTGSGQPLQPNRAVLLHGPTGTVIAVQDKRHGFTILPDIRDAYDLASAPGNPLGEGIIEGNSLTLIESRVGRVAILICEDLDRITQDGSLLREVGASLVLVPIIAPPLIDYRWQRQASIALAKDVGSTVVTFNSVALGRRETYEDSARRRRTRPARTLMVVSPETSSYGTDAQFDYNRNRRHDDEQDALTVRSATVKTP